MHIRADKHNYINKYMHIEIFYIQNSKTNIHIYHTNYLSRPYNSLRFSWDFVLSQNGKNGTVIVLPCPFISFSDTHIFFNVEPYSGGIIDKVLSIIVLLRRRFFDLVISWPKIIDSSRVMYEI